MAETEKRGKGPVQVTFVDDKGKADYRRVPDVVTALRVTDAKGVYKDFPIKITPAMEKRFAAYGVASRVKMFVTHNIEDGTALDLSAQLMADFAEGKMYARAEGTGERRGKVFDPSIYIEAVKLAYQEMFDKKIKFPVGHKRAGELIAAKPASDKQLADFKTSLLAVQGKDRNALLAKTKKNPYFAKHLKMLQAKNIDVTDVDALF